MGKDMIRVDRGDGRLFQFRQGDVQAFLAANPGAKVVPGQNVNLGPTAAEQAASAAQGTPATSAIDESLTRAELDALAAERGVDISGAHTKADVIEALRAHEE